MTKANKPIIANLPLVNSAFFQYLEEVLFMFYFESFNLLKVKRAVTTVELITIISKIPKGVIKKSLELFVL